MRLICGWKRASSFHARAKPLVLLACYYYLSWVFINSINTCCVGAQHRQPHSRATSFYSETSKKSAEGQTELCGFTLHAWNHHQDLAHTDSASMRSHEGKKKHVKDKQRNRCAAVLPPFSLAVWILQHQHWSNWNNCNNHHTNCSNVLWFWMNEFQDKSKSGHILENKIRNRAAGASVSVKLGTHDQQTITAARLFTATFWPDHRPTLIRPLHPIKPTLKLQKG